MVSAATQPGGVFVRPGSGPACRGCAVRVGEGWARARGPCRPGGGGRWRGKRPSWLGVLGVSPRGPSTTPLLYCSHSPLIT